MRKYQQKVEPGVEESIFTGKGANYVRLFSDSKVNVTIKDPDGGQEYVLEPGDDATLSYFDDLRVSHDGAADTLIELWIGRDTRAGSAKIAGTVGVTSMPDDYYHREESGKHFYGYGILGAFNSLYSYVQLFNNSGSGVSLRCTSAIVRQPSTTYMGILTTTVKKDFGTVKGFNKLLGGPDSVADLGVDYGATYGEGTLVSKYELPVANERIEMIPKGGVIVPEGRGLMFVNRTANSSIAANFEWEEF